MSSLLPLSTTAPECRPEKFIRLPAPVFHGFYRAMAAKPPAEPPQSISFLLTLYLVPIIYHIALIIV